LDNAIFVDPEISKAKFEDQVGKWRALSREHGKRGIFLVDACFPTAFAVFAAPQLRPSPVVFGVQLNFDNYDFLPPSVRFLNPFTREPFVRENLPTFFDKSKVPAGIPQMPFLQLQPAVMFQGETGEAFFCAEGVREYHNHPAHTGNPWLKYRTSGRGTLFHILDKLHEFGISILKNYQFVIQVGGIQAGL
jgi:hypothetical protein